MLTSTSIRKNDTVTYFNEYNKSITYNLERLSEGSRTNQDEDVQSLLLDDFAALPWPTLHHLCQLARLIKSYHPEIQWNLEHQVYNLEYSRNRNEMQNQYNTRIPGSVDNYGNTGEWDDDWHAIARYQLYWKEKLMPEIKRKINNE